MDAHKERISLGIKQLTEDHFETFAKDKGLNSISTETLYEAKAHYAR